MWREISANSAIDVSVLVAIDALRNDINIQISTRRYILLNALQIHCIIRITCHALLFFQQKVL